MKKHHVAYVEWDDAKGSVEWTEVSDWEHKPVVCKSVGFLVKEDGTGISIAGCLSTAGHIGQTHFIPKAMITRRFDTEVESDIEDGFEFEAIIGPGKDEKKPRKRGPKKHTRRP